MGTYPGPRPGGGRPPPRRTSPGGTYARGSRDMMSLRLSLGGGPPLCPPPPLSVSVRVSTEGVRVAGTESTERSAEFSSKGFVHIRSIANWKAKILFNPNSNVAMAFAYITTVNKP